MVVFPLKASYSNGSVYLSWPSQKVPGQFVVYRSPKGYTGTPDTIYSGSGLQTVDKNPRPGFTYSYSVTFSPTSNPGDQSLSAVENVFVPVPGGGGSPAPTTPPANTTPSVSNGLLWGGIGLAVFLIVLAVIVGLLYANRNREEDE